MLPSPLPQVLVDGAGGCTFNMESLLGGIVWCDVDDMSSSMSLTGVDCQSFARQDSKEDRIESTCRIVCLKKEKQRCAGDATTR